MSKWACHPFTEKNRTCQASTQYTEKYTVNDFHIEFKQMSSEAKYVYVYGYVCIWVTKPEPTLL